MKKILLAVAVSVVLMASLAIAGEEFIITGYGPGEFAVKGDIEWQAKEMIENWEEKKPAKIIIQGLADKTGKAAENDAVARDRAQEMKAFLEAITDAKITAMSKGESEDARKVIVTVEFSVATVPVEETAIQTQTLALADAEGQSLSPRDMGIIFGVTAIFVLLLIMSFFMLKWLRGEREKEPVLEGEDDDDFGIEIDLNPNPETMLSALPVIMTIGGQEYNFYPEVATDGRFKTFYEIKTGRFMFVRSKSELKKSLHSSFKKNPDLIQRLIGQGRLMTS